MNHNIYKKFSSIHKSSKLSILPHQLATLDFLIDRVLHKNYNVLIYHKTGSGKTMIGTCFSLLATKCKAKVMIILPNQSLMEIWKDHQPHAMSLVPSSDYKIDDIMFETKSSFMKKFVVGKDKIMITNRIKQYNDYIIIVDEAHNIFDSNVGKTLQKMIEFIKLRFVFLSGSPVTNTPDKIINIIELLDGKINHETILDKGKYVYDKQIFKEKLPLIEKKIFDKVSYFIQDPIDVPKCKIEGYVIYQYPVVPCKMSKLQENIYYEILKKEKNMMFSKQIQNVSFAALGNVDYSENTFKTNGKEKSLLPNLSVVDGNFKGNELLKLNISSKILKLVETIKENPCKRLIYFSNSSIGSLVLKSVLPVHGLTEYGSFPVDNFLCINCKFSKKCTECFPVRYIIITSKEIVSNNLNINNILKVFNDRLNKDGRFLCLIFGSEVIEEGYTLKELKEIIFLTVPDSQSILAQVTGRGIRSWSHEDPKNSSVIVKIFIANTSKDNIEKYFEVKKTEFISLDKTTVDTSLKIEQYKKFKKLLDDDSNQLSFDFRKILYLNLKHYGTKLVHKTLKKAGKFYSNNVCSELTDIVIYEYLRQYFYNNNIYNLDDNLFGIFCNNMLKSSLNVKQLISTNSLIVYNKLFGYCNVICNKDLLIVYPIRLKYDRYMLRATIDTETINQQLEYNKKIGNILIIYIKKNDTYNIKLDKGIISNITTLSKKRLIEVSSKYLNMNLDMSLRTEEILKSIVSKCKQLSQNSDTIYYREI